MDSRLLGLENSSASEQKTLSGRPLESQVSASYVKQTPKETVSGWWFFTNPSEKYTQVKMGSSSPNRGENKTKN